MQDDDIAPISASDALAAANAVAQNAEIQHQIRLTRNAGIFACFVSTGTIASCVTPDETALPAALIHIVALVLALAIFLLAKCADSKARTYTRYAIGRGLAGLAAFAIFYGIVVAAQNLRRCISDLCSSPTLYGTREQCLAPCSGTYAAMQIPALVATIFSGFASTAFTACLHLLTCAQHRMVVAAASEDERSNHDSAGIALVEVTGPGVA